MSAVTSVGARPPCSGTPGSTRSETPRQSQSGSPCSRWSMPVGGDDQPAVGAPRRRRAARAPGPREESRRSHHHPEGGHDDGQGTNGALEPSTCPEVVSKAMSRRAQHGDRRTQSPRRPSSRRDGARAPSTPPRRESSARKAADATVPTSSTVGRRSRPAVGPGRHAEPDPLEGGGQSSGSGPAKKMDMSTTRWLTVTWRRGSRWTQSPRPTGSERPASRSQTSCFPTSRRGRPVASPAW